VAAAPPFPGASLLAPAILPSPPTLDAEASPLERTQVLARAFRAGVESRFGEGAAFTAPRPGEVRASKHYATLLAGAEALIAAEIAPAAWVAFSCDLWKRYAVERATEKKGSKAATRRGPSVAWVFNPKRIAERAGWFRAEETTYSGGLAVFGPKHKALLQRHAEMRAALHRAAEPAADIIHRYFPPGAFDRAVAAARRENAEIQQRLRDGVQTGEWFW
jgi:hypothetical protein